MKNFKLLALLFLVTVSVNAQEYMTIASVMERYTEIKAQMQAPLAENLFIPSDIIIREYTDSTGTVYNVYQTINSEYDYLMESFPLVDEELVSLTETDKHRQISLTISDYLGSNFWLQQELKLQSLYVKTPSNDSYVITKQNNGYFYSYTGEYAKNSKVSVTTHTYTSDLHQAFYSILLQSLDIVQRTKEHREFLNDRHGTAQQR